MRRIFSLKAVDTHSDRFSESRSFGKLSQNPNAGFRAESILYLAKENKMKTRIRSIWNISYLAVALMLIFGTSSLAQTGTWTSKAPISSARYFSEAAELNGVLYTAGGWNGCSPYSDFEAYDPLTDTWAPRASMPTARGYHGIAALNGLLYAVGGANGCGSGVANVEAYDPSTNTWTARAPLPTARYGHAVTAANGKLYAIGGSFPTQLASMTEYDPAADTWTERTPMPAPRYVMAVAVVNDIIYVIGGGNYSDGSLATVDAYDSATDTWSSRAPLPVGRQSLGAAVLNGKIYAIGGSGGCTGLTRVDVYDPVTDTWSEGTPLPVKRQDFGIATLNNSIFVVGGYELITCGYVDERSVSTVFAFTPDSDETSPTISIASPANGATYFLGQSVAASYSCEDEAGGSGLASCVGTVADGEAIDTASVGAKSFTVTAADNDGNTSSQEVSYSVIYNFMGFGQPVDNLPALNVASAGSSIPVKFSISGYQGMDIFASGYPVSGPVACDATSPGLVNEPAGTAGSSSLSYDAAIDQYKYVWKTNRTWRGTCRMLVLRFIDGTDRLAKFKFK